MGRIPHNANLMSKTHSPPDLPRTQGRAAYPLRQFPMDGPLSAHRDNCYSQPPAVYLSDKGKPAVMRVRKATGLERRSPFVDSGVAGKSAAFNIALVVSPQSDGESWTIALSRPLLIS